MYKHIISTDTGEQRLQKNKICSKRNTAMDMRYRNSNRYYTQPPVSTDYAENSEPVLQKLSGCLVMF